jgi:benzoyl-CoA reductase/2-hydroxyglutaryl-CoA dehydratase subunit BcrC/BadD/HgdB
MSEEKKALLRRLEAGRTQRKFMADYYVELDQASKSGDKKIAWCTSVGPAELLRGMGFLVYFPETLSAALGTTRKATEYIPFANALGYSPEICSYLTADIGAYTQGYSPFEPLGIDGPPKADVLVFNTNQCRDVQDWFAWYAKEYDAPLVGVHSYRGIAEVTDDHVISMTKQMENLVEPLEEVTGNKLDMDRFKEAVALSKRCSDLWQEVLYSASNVPAPLTFFDGTTLMGPAVVARGTQAANDFYEELLAELNGRVEDGLGAVVDEERFRIYWDGMPIWGRLRAHSELFAGLGANVIASTYCNSWIFSDLDPEEPFRSMATAYTKQFIARSDDVKEEYIRWMLDFFKVDGVVYHNARTCPNNSNCNYGMPQRLTEETGIPSLVIDGDLNDLRCLSDEQTNTNIEAFIEQLAEGK